MIRIALLLPLLYLLFIIKAYPNDTYRVDNYNSNHGLANNHVITTFQDSRGLVWVGTFSGVQIFDGSSFVTFNYSDVGENLFSNHVVYSIAEDSKGNMWFGTEFGLNKYDFNNKEISYSYSSVDSCNYIRDIYIDSDDGLWLATYGGGLKYIDKDDTPTYFRASTSPQSIQSNYLNSLYSHDGKTLWVSSDNGGLSKIDIEKKEIITTYNFTELYGYSNIVNSVFVDFYDNFWVGTWNDGLLLFNKESGNFEKVLLEINGVKQEKLPIRSITQIDKNRLWLATFGKGIIIYDIINKTSQAVTLSRTELSSTKQDFVWNIEKDRSNNIWISTFGSGLYLINQDRNIFPSYVLRDKESMTRLSISTFAEDKSGNLWIGTFNGDIFVKEKGTYFFKRFEPNVWKDNISYIYVDSKNWIWIGMRSKLLAISPDRTTTREYRHDETNPSSLSKSEISTIIEDFDGNIWLGFWGEGINYLSKEERGKSNLKEAKFEKYTYTGGEGSHLPHNNIWKLFQDSRGTIWVANPGQLTYYDKGQFNWLEIYAVSSLTEDREGNLWLASMEQDVIKLNKNYEVESSYGMSDGLSSDKFTGILIDDRNRIWVGSDKGFSMFEPSSRQVMNFSKLHGFEFDEVSFNTCIKQNDGSLVFGGNEGFTIFNPNTLNFKAFTGALYIKDVKVGYNSSLVDTVSYKGDYLLNPLESIDIGFKEKVLSIEVAAVDYFNADNIRYSYRLEGFDDEWVVANKNDRIVTYTNLKPGKYVFRVRASYNNSNWSDETTKLYINIKKPFWIQTWFVGLVIMLFAVAFSVLIKRRIKATKEILTQKNNELINENLKKENDILVIENNKLKESNEELQKEFAEVTYQNLNIKEFITLVYNELNDIRSEALNVAGYRRKIGLMVKNIEQNKDEVIESDAVLSNTVNLFFDDFQKRLLDEFPKLTPQDVRICSYIRLNKSNKDIASLLNITPASLDTSRYRLRKKMKLSQGVNLNEFILKM